MAESQSDTGNRTWGWHVAKRQHRVVKTSCKHSRTRAQRRAGRTQGGTAAGESWEHRRLNSPCCGRAAAAAAATDDDSAARAPAPADGLARAPGNNREAAGDDWDARARVWRGRDGLGGHDARRHRLRNDAACDGLGFDGAR